MYQPTSRRVPSRDGAATVLGKPREDALPIYIHQETLSAMLAYSERQPRRETGGFLLGGWHQDKGREYVEIRHFLPAQAARSRSNSLTFTHDTWSEMHRRVEQQFPDEQIVGWQHTHPDFGVFLSPHDRFLHRHFFAARWQVALVVDPQRHEFGFYQWSGDQIVDCGFICVSAQASPAGGSPSASQTGARTEEKA